MKVQSLDDVVIEVGGYEITPTQEPSPEEPTGFIPVFDKYTHALKWADGDESMVMTFEEIDA